MSIEFHNVPFATSRMTEATYAARPRVGAREWVKHAKSERVPERHAPHLAGPLGAGGCRQRVRTRLGRGHRGDAYLHSLRFHDVRQLAHRLAFPSQRLCLAEGVRAPGGRLLALSRMTDGQRELDVGRLAVSTLMVGPNRSGNGERMRDSDAAPSVRHCHRRMPIVLVGWRAQCPDSRGVR